MPKKKSKRHWYSRKGKHRKKGTQVSIPIIATVSLPALRAIQGGLPQIESGDIIGGAQKIGEYLVAEYTGYLPWEGRFDWGHLVQTYLPIGIAVGAHQFLGKRVNPYIKRIPLVGKYIGV
jgi:hypothetical protein